MDDVQLELAHERISKHTGVSLGRLSAHKNFTMLKRQHVSRTGLVEKLSM
jgi:hypothetical protein